MTTDSNLGKKIMVKIKDGNNSISSTEKDVSKFSRLVPSLMRIGVDNLKLTMFNPDTKFQLLSALGEEYRKKGNLNDAAKTFLLAENKNGLNSVGEDYEKLLQFDNCIEVYKMSENYERLIGVGKRCLQEIKLKQAAKAFVITNYDEGLKQVAKECLEHYRFDQAFEVLLIVDNKEKFIEFGNRCVEQREYAYAINSFGKAGDVNKLNMVGDILLKDEYLQLAYEAYKLADNEIMIEFLKENFAKGGTGKAAPSSKNS